jgi:hypothetical protein
LLGSEGYQVINQRAVEELRRQTHDVVRAWFAMHSGEGDLLRRISFEINVNYAEAGDYVDRVVPHSSCSSQFELFTEPAAQTTDQEGGQDGQ